MKPLLIQLAIASLLSGFALAAAPHPSFCRVAVVDDSGSMQGDRIATVKAELLAIADHVPPSPGQPILLVVFGSAVNAAKGGLFTDPAAFKKAVTQLNGGSGGTDIARGLEAGMDGLKKFNTSHNIMLLLFSDGGDSNPRIAEVENTINAIFADRKQHNLSNTVYLKRWGGANAQLAAALREAGHATVIDDADAALALRPVTFKPPTVTINDVQWSVKHSKSLEVTYSPEIAIAKGTLPDNDQGTLEFAVQNTGAKGDVTVLVTPGTKPKQYTVTLPITITNNSVPKTVELAFTVRPEPGDKPLFLPILPTNTVRVPVTVPTRILRQTITASGSTDGPPKWIDALQLKAAFPVETEFKVVPAVDLGVTYATHLRVTAGKGQRIIQGNTSPILPRPGTYRVRYLVEATPVNPASVHDELRYNLSLKATPVSQTAGITYEPAHVDLTINSIPAPPPINTDITARVQATSGAVWQNISLGQAVFRVAALFNVDGPIAPNSRITLVSPPGVADVRFSPQTLHRGEQLVTLTVVATLQAAPESTKLMFQIVPPKPAGGVRLRARSPLSVTVRGPAPLLPALTDGRQVLRSLDVTVPDNQSSARVGLIPILQGVEPSVADGLTVTLRGDAKLQLPANGLPFSKRTPFSFPVPGSKPPFWRDKAEIGKLRIEPGVPTPAIQAIEMPYRFVKAARFKRIAMWLMLIITPIVTGYLLWTMFARLRTVDS